MNKKLIIANWKMNPQTTKEAESLLKRVLKDSKGLKNISIGVCAPFVFLSNLKKISNSLKNKKIALGAQNVFYKKEGAYTGEVSVGMLKSLGLKYVIIGHSERRIMGEKEEVISRKVLNVLKSGMTPILCIGEKVRGTSMDYISFIRKQIIHSLESIPKSLFKKIIIAYEPIWAIGKNAVREATPEESSEMSIYIKKIVSDLSDPKTAHDIKILYGGSVNSKNSDQFLTRGGVNGLLIGGASLKIKEFSKIITNADKLK